MKKYLKVKSVAERYDIGISTVWYWVRIGKLPKPYKVAANTTRWLATELDELDSQDKRLTEGKKRLKGARWGK